MIDDDTRPDEPTIPDSDLDSDQVALDLQQADLVADPHPVDDLAPEPAAPEPTIGAGVPAVVVVIPTRDPGPWFDEALAALALQEYPALSILVIDAGSVEDPTPRVAAACPRAFVRRMTRRLDFSDAVNQVLGSVEGATFYLLCHDDARLGPDSVQTMVTEAFRSNAGIVGAKLVDWDRPERLRSLGVRVDRFGFPVPIAEPDELDQAQHDVVGDVFAVSSAAMLIRADLFADLGGFASGVDPSGAELDLCWRARIAGARTVVTPTAIVRHRELSPLADDDSGQRRRADRFRARALFVSAGARTLLVTIPLALLYSVADFLGCLVTGRFRRAADVAGAWWWNLAHIIPTARARGVAQKMRRVPEGEVRSGQVRGSARISGSLRTLRSAGEERIPAALAAARDLPTTMSTDGTISGVIALGALLLMVLLGSRGLLTDGVRSLREITPIDSGSELLRSWWDGWRTIGFGNGTAAPTSHGVLAALSGVTLGSNGFLRLITILVPLLLGPVGAWRLLRSVATVRARLATAVAYALVGLPYEAVAQGRLSALAVWAGLPFLLSRALRATGADPFDSSRRGPARCGIGLGLIAGLVALGTPLATVAGILVILSLSIALVLMASGDSARAVASIVAGASALVTLAVVALPTTIDLVSNRQRLGSIFGRTTVAPPGRLSLFALTTESGWLATTSIGVSIAAVLVLLVGRGWRLRWGSLGWVLAAASWLAVSGAARFWPGADLPPVQLMLAPAAIGLAMNVGLGVASFDTDVLGGRFGWRQVASGFATVAFLAATLPFLGHLLDGRWGQPSTDLETTVRALEPDGTPQFRVVWVGRRDELPTISQDLQRNGLGIGLTTGFRPTPDDQTSSPSSVHERAIVGQIDAALDGESHALGRILAAQSVQYVVVLHDAAARSIEPEADIASTIRSLSEQLDLEPLEGFRGVRVFRTPPARPLRAVASRAGETLGDLSPAFDAGRPPSLFTGQAPENSSVILGFGGSDWVLETPSSTINPVVADGRQRFDVGSGGTASLRYDTPVRYRLAIVLQLLAILVLTLLARGRTPARPGRRSRESMS